MCQNGCPKGRGQKSLKLVFFSLVPLWVPLGSFSLTFGLPGHHFGTFLGALGIILAPLGPTKMMPRQCKIQWKWILKPTWLGSFFLSFEIPGYHFGTLDPRHKCNLLVPRHCLFPGMVSGCPGTAYSLEWSVTQALPIPWNGQWPRHCLFPGMVSGSKQMRCSAVAGIAL